MKFIPSPTGELFIRDRSFGKVIMGPVGGGKSTLCLMDLITRAYSQDPFNGLRRTKFAIVRNTAAQLLSTVKPLIDEWLVSMPLQQHGRALGQWRITEKTFEIRGPGPLDDDGEPTQVHTELVLLAADTPDDVRRLLSLQLSAAWVEEAREIDPEILKGLLGRVDRFPSKVAGGVTYPGVIASTNAPAMDTYWQGLIEEPPENFAVFIQPSAVLDDGSINPEAENLEYLSEDYYPNLMAANTKEWVEVYLRNKFGPGNAGQPVYRASFKRSFHTAASPLAAIPSQGSPIIVGCDNGLQAAAVIMQQDARSRVNVLSSCYVDKDITMGFEKFLDTLLIPHLSNKYPRAARSNFLFVMDPACFQRSQLNEATLAQAVTARGYPAVRASTNDPEKRVAAVEGLLTRAIDGQAGMLIDPSNAHLLKALEWGYRYKKSADGSVTLTFDKNHFSHICFPAGTEVATPGGPVPIEALARGDVVDTPIGPRRVEAAMSRVAHELVELVFDDGRVLTCTPEHPIWTDEGFVRADALRYDANVLAHGARECDPASIQFRSSWALGTTASRAGTSNPTSTSTAASTCTASCGSAATALSPPGITCTTSTGTKPTTGSTTSSSKLRVGTLPTTWSSSTPAASVVRKMRSLWKRAAQLQRGTARRLAATRLGAGLLRLGQAAVYACSGALTAALSSVAVRGRLSGGSAALHASPQLGGLLAWTTLSAPAVSAGERTKPTGTEAGVRAPRLVRRRRFLAPDGVQVFDLEVAEVHVFYAEGVLVSNCDAHQYGCLHFNAQFSQTVTAYRTVARPVKAVRKFVYS